MTQKELSYIEDAISHEANICIIVEDIISNLEDEELAQYMEKELKEHEKTKKDLIKLLEGECNE